LKLARRGGGVVTRPAKLRFADPKYGFSTPPARFLAVTYDEHGRVSSVRMSPQVEALPLDETMEVVTELQDQLRRAGWKRFRLADDPPIEDVSSVRAKIRRCEAPRAYWGAADKFQLMLIVGCISTDEQPGKERYLTTLSLSAPWIPDDAR
jgi:hypothetical protein